MRACSSRGRPPSRTMIIITENTVACALTFSSICSKFSAPSLMRFSTFNWSERNKSCARSFPDQPLPFRPVQPCERLTCDSLSASGARVESEVDQDCVGRLCPVVGVAVPLEVPPSVEVGIERLPWLLCSETAAGILPDHPKAHSREDKIREDTETQQISPEA